VQDARRHGVVVRTPDVNISAAAAILEPCDESHHGVAVRLGVGSVRGLGTEVAERIEAGRPYADMEDLTRRAQLTLEHLEALATAGALGCFPSPPSSGAGERGLQRREALWVAGAVAQSKPDRLAGVVTGAEAPTLPGMSPMEESAADLWATGVSPEGHPTRFVRPHLDSLGVLTATALKEAPDGDRVQVAGVVTHRQRPATAAGITFINLEDETGLINVVVSLGCWNRYRRLARTAPALLIRGRLEKVEGVINVVADKLEPLPLAARTRSRDFR
jgi:error-prone DNA polymerase